MENATIEDAVIKSSKQGVEFDPNRVPGHHIDGWMHEVELYWLNDVAKSMHQIVEIGSWVGRSSYALAEGCPGRVICVDHFNGGGLDWTTAHARSEEETQFRDNLKEFMESGKVELLKMTSEEAEKQCDGFVDMVFIDGAHDYESVKKDILLWAPHVKLILAGHDFNMPGVQQAVLEIFGKSVRNGFGSIWYVEFCNGIGKVA